MLHKFGVPVARYLHRTSLSFLQKYNPYSTHVVPETSVNPVFMLHTGAMLSAGGADQIKPWLPLFDQLGMEYLVVTRAVDVYDYMLREYSHVAVSLVSSSVDADKLVDRFPSLSGFFYVANTANNNQFLRYPGVRHVFLGHGDSDKSASVNRLFKCYDEVYVAGQAHIDRFKKADFGMADVAFKIVGRPDTRALLSQCAQRGGSIARILYLPTWEGYHQDQAYSSLPIAESILRAAHAIGQMPMVAKLHPMTGLMRSDYRQAEQRIVNALGLSREQLSFASQHSKLTDCLVPDAIFVCDISAAVSDCLTFDRPIFVYVPKDPKLAVVSGTYSYADYAYTFTDEREFSEKLSAVVAGDDWLAGVRRAARDYFISPEATLGEAFKQQLRAVAARQWQVQEGAQQSAVDTWPAPGLCAACGSNDVAQQTIASEIAAAKGKVCDFLICGACGFVSNPKNTHDYVYSGFGATSDPQMGTRAGDGIQPRREYRMAEMAVDILSRRSIGQRPDVLIFGPGLSRDHALIAQSLEVASVALTDMGNFQSATNFVPLEATDSTFDIVVASEVIEHFTDLKTDFTNLLSKVKTDGLVVASTNVNDGWPLRRLIYPFITGHTAYYSGRALQAVARRFGMIVDFRVPAIAFGSAGPRKRYIFFYHDPRLAESISAYFADHHVAPSE